MKRVCKSCKEEKDINEFANAGVIKEKQYFRFKCKKCYWKSKKPRISNTRKWFRELKKTMKCNRCNNSDYRVLEFHHLYNKEFNISNAMSHGKESILNEIKKCEILCANCHRIEHYIEDVV